MRSKEDAKDYRYFPEPDLAPIDISNEWIQQIKEKQPELRDEKRLRYQKEYDIPEYDINILTSSKKLADIFENTIALCQKPKEVSNWLMVETMRLLKEEEKDLEDISFSPINLSKLIKLIETGVINRTVAKEVFEVIFREDIDPETYVEENGLKTVNDEGMLYRVVEEIIKANPQSVNDYYSGKTKALGFLVGQTMKQMKGKVDPGKVNKILLELLGREE